MTLAGLRPGEKLFEEKLMAEEGLKKTKNKLIHIGCPIPFNTEQFLQQLTVLMKAAYDNDQNIREMVELIVPTYHPAGKNGSENKGKKCVRTPGDGRKIIRMGMKGKNEDRRDLTLLQNSFNKEKYVNSLVRV